MRSFTVTALIATGLLGAAAPAWAATRPAVHGTPVPAHPAFARPQAHGALAHPAARPAARPQAEPHGRIQPATEPRPHILPATDARPRILPALEPRRYLRTEPHPQAEPSRDLPGRSGPARAAYVLNMTGQAEHWEVAPGQMELVRWTLINAGERRLEHVQLVASVPPGWVVRDGEGCAHRGAYLGCDLGSLEPGKSAAVVVPMVAQRPFGAVRLTAWSRANAGRLTIPGPTTSFRVFVVGHR